MKRAAARERELHAAVAQWLRLAVRPPTTWTTFPAGGGGLERGRMLQRLGLRAGWPDIIVMHPAGMLPYSIVVGLELKTDVGRQSVTQRQVAAEFSEVAADYRICRSLEDVERALRDHMIPVHASVRARAAA